MIGNFQAIIAEDYIENLRQETLKGQMGRLKQGLTPWAAPVGYLDNGKGKPKTIDPVKGPLVKELFELYARGAFSIAALTNVMHAKGLSNTSGGKLSKTCISKTLNNPFYIGRIYVRKWNKGFNGIHEPLISKSLFYAVQDRLTGKARSSGHKHSYRYSKSFRCGLCSYSMIGERQKGHVYYRCHTKTCPTKGIRETAIDSEIEQLLAALRLDETTYSLLAASLTERRKNSQADEDKAVQALSLQIANIRSRKERLTDLRLDDEIDADNYKKKKADIQRQLDELEEKEVLIKGQPDHVYNQVEEILELAKSLISRDETEINGNINNLLQKISSNRTISPESIDIPCVSPWHVLLDRSKIQSCAQDRDTTRTAEAIIEAAPGYSEAKSPTSTKSYLELMPLLF